MREDTDGAQYCGKLVDVPLEVGGIAGGLLCNNLSNCVPAWGEAIPCEFLCTSSSLVLKPMHEDDHALRVGHHL